MNVDGRKRNEPVIEIGGLPLIESFGSGWILIPRIRSPAAIRPNSVKAPNDFAVGNISRGPLYFGELKNVCI